VNLPDSEILDVIPEEIKPIVKLLLEGRIKQMVVIAELDDGNILDCYPVLDDSAHRYAMVGAIENLKRDYMRSHIQSRVPYVEEP
jgi:hypothetical protein